MRLSLKKIWNKIFMSGLLYYVVDAFSKVKTKEELLSENTQILDLADRYVEDQFYSDEEFQKEQETDCKLTANNPQLK